MEKWKRNTIFFLSFFYGSTKIKELDGSDKTILWSDSKHRELANFEYNFDFYKHAYFFRTRNTWKYQLKEKVITTIHSFKLKYLFVLVLYVLFVQFRLKINMIIQKTCSFM